MSRYPALVRALQQGRELRMATLVRLDFASTTSRIWDSVGPLRATDPVEGSDQVWDGIGRLAQISDIDRALVSTAGAPKLTLSGVDPQLVGKAMAAGTEVKGRPCRIFEQYFDVETAARVDVPLVVYAGLMDRIQIAVDGPTTATVTLSLVTLLYNRRRPAYGYLSAVSQRALSPGDAGADEISALVQRDPAWPTY